MDKSTWGLIVFAVSAIGAGVYRGLQDRFGHNVIEGYRAYKEECRQWDAIKAADSRRDADMSR